MGLWDLMPKALEAAKSNKQASATGTPRPSSSTAGPLKNPFNIPIGFENYPLPDNPTKKDIETLARQLTSAFVQPDYAALKRKYGDSWKDVFNEQKKGYNDLMDIVVKHEGTYKRGEFDEGYVNRAKGDDGSYYYINKMPTPSLSEIESDLRNASTKPKGSIVRIYHKDYQWKDIFPNGVNDKNFSEAIKNARQYIVDEYRTTKRNQQNHWIYGDNVDVATYVAQMLSAKKQYEDLGEKTWGPDFETNPEYKAWIERSVGDSSATTEQILTNISKDKDIKSITLPSNIKPPPGVKKGGIAGLDIIGDFFEAVGGAVFDVVTAPVEPFVKLGEVTQDVITGDSNVLDAVSDFALDVTGADHLVDAGEAIQEGDIVGATLDTYEYAYDAQANTESGSFVGNNPSGDLTNEISSATLDVINEVSDPSNDNFLSNLREDINETVMGEDYTPPEQKDIDLGDYESGKTIADLKALLGIAPDAHPSNIVEALIGDEARKMADDPDIKRMRELQGQVSETGYDVGEREALSSRARRELAGKARQAGMAAGAAAGGVRGASVAAQARSIMDEAMQKQADVTTEMDKASIARKDDARKELAALAKGVTQFDIDKEEERKKRKGATTIGIQSLISQEDMMKQQLDLAKQG